MSKESQHWGSRVTLSIPGSRPAVQRSASPKTPWVESLEQLQSEEEKVLANIRRYNEKLV